MKQIALVLALSLPVVSKAAVSLQFDDVSTFGGSLVYGGANGVDPLVGTDIILDQVTGVGTVPSGPLDILNGRLNFVTGPNTSEGAVVYTFGPGGTFVLTGTVIRPDLSVVASGVLLTGTFDSTSVVLGLGGGQGLFSGVGIDTKNPDLLAYYGLGLTDFRFASTEIGFAAAGLEADGGFVAAVQNSDLTNVPIPEPSTALAGLILAVVPGLGWAYRRLSGSGRVTAA